MSNVEFTSEFSRRTSSLLAEDKAIEVANEFDELDPREANIVYRAFNATQGSPEYVHATTRLKALVAAGFVSQELALVATSGEPQAAPEQAAPAENNDSYELSRQAFLEELSNQTTDDNPYVNLYDEDGSLARMVARGNSKEEISNYLATLPAFKSNQDLLNATDDNNEIDGQEDLSKFKDFLDAINNLEDPAQAPDLKAIAKEHIAKYDSNGDVSSLIDNGSKSEEIFQALNEDPQWSDDVYNMLTRLDVTLPTVDQNTKWDATQQAIFAIKDLDSL